MKGFESAENVQSLATFKFKFYHIFYIPDHFETNIKNYIQFCYLHRNVKQNICSQHQQGK